MLDIGLLKSAYRRIRRVLREPGPPGGGKPAVNAHPEDLEAKSGDCLRALANKLEGQDCLYPALIDKAALYVYLQSMYRESVTDFYPTADSNGIGHAVAGSIKLFDAMSIAAAIDLLKPRKILEIGSFLGFSTRWMLECSRPYNTEITSVDPGLRHRIFDDLPGHLAEFNRDFVSEGRLTIRNAFFGLKKTESFYYDYRQFEPVKSEREIEEILAGTPLIDEPFDQFDLIFIDGDHSYPATVNNLALAVQMVRRPGCIIVHDAITWRDVQPALHDLAEDENLDIEYLGVTGASAQEFLGNWWQNIDASLAQAHNLHHSLCDGLAYVFCPDKG